MSNASTSFSLDDFDRLVDQKLEEKSLKRAELYRREELLWMALAPGWTVPLAEKSGFPVSNITSYLEELRERALVRQSEVRSENDEAPLASVYTMNEGTRADVIEMYSEGREIDELQPVMTRIGKSILSAIGERVSEPPSFAPPAVARWAVLAAHLSSPGGVVEQLDSRVEEAFVSRDSGTIRDWMNAAQPFSALLLRRGDDSMKQALQRATQRSILLRREENDQRHLKYFYERDEQLKAFKELMNSGNNTWALHFLGAGGVGKTMLVRKITVDWARDHDAIAARVDFDYLKADYPILDPGMLLWAFAQDLRAHAGPDSIRLFNKADRGFEELSKRLRSDRSKARGRATDYPEFKEAISQYAEAIRQIRKRVVLIVDTCEELAKIGIGRTPVENIDETFRILRALHDGPETLEDDAATPNGGVPGLRVIFSGRRPLASEGANWRCPSASLLRPRDFLRLHEVRGFKQPDARSFLLGKMQVSRALIAPIVTRSSPDTGSVAEIDWDDPRDGPTQEPRCNPYDLKLYAEWAKEDPPPTAAEILATPPATQYVELRVIRRLHYEPLKDVLPAVALLGHFDSRALHQIFEGKKDKETIDTVFDLLQEEEWINQHLVQDADGGTNLMLDVEPGLRTRLFVYFRKSPLLADVQPQAADYFEQITLEGNLSALDWSSFDAALTVLECDPDKTRVTRWWKKVEERILLSRPPEWIRDVTDKLQNEGGAAAWRDPQGPPDFPPESRLRAAVLATYASALLRSAKPAEINVTWRELKKIWQEVLAKATTLSKEMPELEMRARAGFISASLRVDDAEPDLEQIGHLWRFVEERAAATETAGVSTDDPQPLEPPCDPQLLASLVAAAEAIVEFADSNAHSIVLALLTVDSQKSRRSAISRLLPILSKVSESAQHSDRLRFLFSFAACLAARAEIILGNYGVTGGLFEQSLALVDYDNQRASREAPWFDWLPPEDMASRIRLEFALATYPDLAGPEEIITQVGEPPINLTLIDNDRLHSALLRIRSFETPVEAQRMGKFEGIVGPSGFSLYVRSQNQPVAKNNPDGSSEALTCRAHHATAPLFVTVGEILANQGRADEVLHDLAAMAHSRAHISYNTLLSIDRTSSRIILRMRLRDVGEKGGQTLVTAGDISDMALAWALDAQDGPKNKKPTPQLPAELAVIEILPNQSGHPAVEKIGHTISIERAGFTKPQIEKLRWLHAIWQTRYALDAATAEIALAWAEQNLKSCLAVDFEEFPCYELAAVQIDCFEAVALARRYQRELNLGQISRRSFTPEFFLDRDELTLVEALTLWLRARAMDDQSSPSLSIWPVPEWEQIGRWRAAEIALYEADLLALRLPKRASILFREAQRRFIGCHDHIGAFFAGTSETMMIAPQVSNLAQAVASSFASFGLAKDTGLDLPTTDQLAEFVEMKTPTVANDWAPRAWQPRLVRYMLLLAANKFADKRAEAGKQIIERFLPGALSTGTDAPDLLPADLTNWLSDTLEPPSISRRWFKAIQRLLPVLGGLAIIVASVVALFRGFQWLFSFLVPDFTGRDWRLQWATFALVTTTLSLAVRLLFKVRPRPSSTPSVSIESDSAVSDEAQISEEYPTRRIWLDGLVIWVLVVSIWWFYSPQPVPSSWSRLAIIFSFVVGSSLLVVFRSRFSRLGKWLEEINRETLSALLTNFIRLQLKVRPIHVAPVNTDRPSTEDLDITLIPSLRIFKFFAPFVRQLTPKSVVGEISSKSGLQRYESLGKELSQDTIAREFSSLHATLRKFSMELEVDLPEGPVNGLCWEALVPRGGTPREKAFEYSPFSCYRKLSLATRRLPARSETINVLALAEGDLGRPLANDGWGALTRETTPAFSFELKDRSEVFAKHVRPEISIIHLVGSIESSYVGLGLRLGEERSQLTTTGTESIDEGDSLIRVEDLTRAFPNVSVCILQEEPRQVSSQRLDGDRRDASSARLFASQMFATGVPFVLVIPPLRITEAIMAIDHLAQLLLRRSRFRRPELLGAIADLRRQIGRYAASLDVDQVTAQELPQDLCLYLNPEWDGRLVT